MSDAEAGLPAVGPRLVRPSRDRRRGLAGEGGVSLLVHVLLMVALIIVLPRPRQNDLVGSSQIAVVFDNGGATQSAPQTQESRRSTPSTAPDERQTQPQPPGVAPSPRQGPAPTHTAPPGRPSAQTPPASRQAAPSRAVPTQVVPSPAMPQTPPIEVPEGRSSVQLPPASRSARAVPMRPPAPARPAQSGGFGSLSAPMNFSFSGRPPPPASAGHLARGITLSMAPTDQNRNIMTRYAEARHALGEDWWAAFSAFVEAHKYYPLAAVERGEDGNVVLHLVIERDGTVRSVEVERSSGSPRLDDAWVSEFRDVKVPPFPPGTIEPEISFPASMNYILEHL